MKVAVIGGGSSYTPELVKGFLDRVESLPLSELWLVDISPQRLETVGGFAQRMVRAVGQPFTVHLTADQKDGIAGASYVIVQLRVGGMRARREDEYLGHRHGLIGQETTGVGGMANALRTIPVLLDIAADMRKMAPEALLVNFTNPSGLVTQALALHAPEVRAVGVCNSPITTQMAILEGLAKHGVTIPEGTIELDALGLNHLTWYRGLQAGGQDLWTRFLDTYLADPDSYDVHHFAPSLVASLAMLPNSYLQYYYQTAAKLAEQAKWPPSRAEKVMEIEKQLLAQYAEPERSQPPTDLMKRGGAYYSTVAVQLLDAHYNDSGETHVVNVPHRGAVPGWPEEWVLEMPCRVSRAGISPLSAPPLPPACYGLTVQVKMYELLTVAAAVHGDRNAAYQALLAHPLGPPADRIEAVLEDMLHTNRQHLPQFQQ